MFYETSGVFDENYTFTFVKWNYIDVEIKIYCSDIYEENYKEYFITFNYKEYFIIKLKGGDIFKIFPTSVYKNWI